MDLLLKKREFVRKSFVVLVNKFNASFGLDKNNTKVHFKALKERHDEILVFDQEIFDLFLLEKDDDEISAEVSNQDEFKDLFLRTEVKMNDEVLSCGQSEVIESSSQILKRSLRLPKVELVKFSGEAKDWLSFWSLFQSIDKDLTLSNEEKFQYLLQSMIPNSRAYNIVKSFPPTTENYPKALEELKTRFGREGLLVQVYVRELLSLVLDNSLYSGLSQFYDKLECQLRALESLNVTSEKCAAILLPLVESRLPEDLLRAWQRSNFFTSDSDRRKGESSEEEFALQQLRKFIKSEVENEERISIAKSNFSVEKKVSSRQPKLFGPSIPSGASLVSTKSETKDRIVESRCIFCSGFHRSVNCLKAKSMGLEQKRKVVVEKRACFVCLSLDHIAKDCDSSIKCIICKKRHARVMCDKDLKKMYCNSRVDSETKEVKDLSNCNQSTVVFLQTVVVTLKHGHRDKQVRALIDTGSMRSYILNSTAREMNLDVIKEENLAHSLFGGISTEVYNHKVYSIVLSKLVGDYHCRFQVLNQDTICEGIPSLERGSLMDELQNSEVVLTDIENSDSKIEVLIGADVAGKLFTGKKVQLKNGLVALETYLGWTIMGKVTKGYAKHGNSVANAMISMFASTPCISEFWKLETIGITDPAESKNKQELSELVLKHFNETVSRNQENHYEVSLPWIEECSILPSNFELAKKRLQSTVDKTRRMGYFEQYQEVLDSWNSEKVIEVVEKHDAKHFIPHRAVLKEGSTTPLRPVFDASAHEKGRPSLNDCLEKGVNFIEKIPSLLNRFRLHKFGVISDIKKAFLQISIREDDRKFLSFLWVDEKGEFRIYRHRRVVFGLTSSPFLLGAVINHHLQLSKSVFKSEFDVIELLERSFYVDNCVVSLDSREDVDRFITSATSVMADGLFCLRGWEFSGEESEHPTSKVLGLDWNKADDTLQVSLSLDEDSGKTVTKRSILSKAQKMFDPLGFLSPVTLVPKLLLQRTWELKLKWDEEIVGDIKKEFVTWKYNLQYLNEIKLPRWLIGSSDVLDMTLHTFCDASKTAFAAAVFLRIECVERVFVQLVQGKSRVSPIKRVSIPRLELLAATIGVRLLSSVKESDEVLGNLKSYFWTDSSTCLAWIKLNESWATFVRNRVEEIRKFSNTSEWRYVPGNQNPADLPSRGCNAKKFLESKWWLGPEWLYRNEEFWPSNDLVWNDEEVNSEKCKTVVSSLVETSTYQDWYYKYLSSYNKIVRVMGWVLRFVNSCRLKGNKSGFLSIEEVMNAETKIVSIVQQEYFLGDRLRCLRNFDTFLDDSGVIRLRTRIVLREDVHDFSHPAVLPPKHPVVNMLIRQYHEDFCHVGVQGLLCTLRQRFWVVGGRRSVKAVVQQCVTCRRHTAKKFEAPMAPLPLERVRDPVAFEVCGIDMAGPVYLKENVKAYITVFSCAVVRAIHLELVLSLSTESFIQALRRFISRRGRPMTIISDNGTNFVGTENLFKCLDWEKIQSVQRIKWKFNPPSSPWWGGFYERMIKMLKELLRRVLKKTSLNYEEMITILCECEGVINSRPLTYLSEDPNDLTPLTPSTFLQDLKDVRMTDMDAIENISLTRKALYKQRLRNNLNVRFRNEYLSQLRQQVYKKSFRPPELGEIVLVGNDNDKRLNWVVGRIIEVFTGKDGIVRLVKVKTSSSELMRPIQRIYPLEVRDKSQMEIDFTQKKLDKMSTSELSDASDNQKSDAESMPESNIREETVTRSGRRVKAPVRFWPT